MVVTVAVRVADPVGWLGSDDASYHAAAEHVLKGQSFQRVHHHWARSPVILAVAASMWLFGESPSTLALPMLVASVLCVALVAILGRLLWGWWEGLCAATILSFIPVFQNASTCVLPGGHACLWITAAIVLTVASTHMRSFKWTLVCAVGCGLALGLATSAKVFCAFAGFGVLVIVLARFSMSRRKRITWLACAVLGVLLLFAAEGFFYAWAANDFWYKLHAIQNTQTGAEGAHHDVYSSAAGVMRLVWNRLTMPFRPAQSGWGRIGMAFWPVVLAALLFDRKGRGIAVWAAATYLIVAFVPISLKNGPRLFPWFDGRNISVVCVPFALCLAWGLHSVTNYAFRPAVIRRSWPILLAAITVVSGVDRSRLNCSLEFHQQDLARAVERLVATTDWDRDREVFMTPSMYWRYRLLFPSSLRLQLRVAADADAPVWWRNMTVDIVDRWKPLPPPAEAYLIATPEQLAGGCHSWDYGVGLPRDALDVWRRTVPIVHLSRTHDGNVGLGKADAGAGKGILILLGGDAPKSRVAARNRS
jgi:hypothetical protein